MKINKCEIEFVQRVVFSNMETCDGFEMRTNTPWNIHYSKLKYVLMFSLRISKSTQIRTHDFLNSQSERKERVAIAQVVPPYLSHKKWMNFHSFQLKKTKLTGKKKKSDFFTRCPINSIADCAKTCLIIVSHKFQHNRLNGACRRNTILHF